MGEILAELAQAAGGGERRLTQVAARSNLPYDRFREYLADLQAKGLLDAEDPFRLTEAGRKFLRDYRAWRETLRLFGMSPE